MSYLISVLQREGDERKEKKERGKRVPVSGNQKPSQRFWHQFSEETISEHEVGVWVGEASGDMGAIPTHQDPLWICKHWFWASHILPV